MVVNRGQGLSTYFFLAGARCDLGKGYQPGCEGQSLDVDERVSPAGVIEPKAAP